MQLSAYGNINITGDMVFAANRIMRVCDVLRLTHTLIPLQSCTTLKLILGDNHYRQLVEDGRSLDHVVIIYLYNIYHTYIYINTYIFS
jgi:hypothetical protein